MTKSSLKERFARLGPVRDVARDRSGSPVDLMLRRERTRVDTVSAAETLAKRGLSMLRAKRTVELLVDQGEVGVRLPSVRFVADLVGELKRAGIATRRMARSSPGEVRDLLRDMRSKLGITQEQFALRFGFDLDALQNWEQGRRTPDRAIVSYLRVIARNPEAAARAQEEEEPA